MSQAEKKETSGWSSGLVSCVLCYFAFIIISSSSSKEQVFLYKQQTKEGIVAVFEGSQAEANAQMMAQLHYEKYGVRLVVLNKRIR